MSTTTLKTASRAVLFSLLLVTAAACSNVAPPQQVAVSNIAALNLEGQGAN
jgi:hypothetical protein